MLYALVYSSVRLRPNDLDAIVKCFTNTFSPNDHLCFFGSRVNLQARGGDIDLYIETAESNADLIIKRRAKFVWDICGEIGEQKIDVVIRMTKDKFHIPIYDKALNNGVKLV